MKVLFVGDSPTVSTGFSKCTLSACNELYNTGNEVHILGINAYGDSHEFPFQIYSAYQPNDGGYDLFGTTRLPRLIDRLSPDVVVILQDPWNIKEYLDNIKSYSDSKVKQGYTALNVPPIVGWLAVDSKNQKAAPSLNALSHVVTWTKFGIDELINSGYTGKSSIVPLGVDTELFRPIDKLEARSRICPPNVKPNDFIIGVVGRNQPRKRIDLSIQYFAEWVKRYEIKNAWLYLHVAPTGEKGCDIKSLVDYYGISGRVMLSEPHVGKGEPEAIMPYVYSSFDAYLSTSQAEGWNLCLHEAMACGVVCIYPDYAAMGDWPGESGVKIPCTSSALSAPLNSKAYTLGGIADKEITIQALNDVYKCGIAGRELIGASGRYVAYQYTWKDTGKKFRSVLENVVQEHEEQAA